MLIALQDGSPILGDFTAVFRHLGASGLFFLAIVDSSPLPTFAGPDILTAVLAASHRNPWYEYAIVATAGSLLGAALTFRLAQKAGEVYLRSKFGSGKVSWVLNVFKNWGTGTLVASTAIPFPFPTSLIFAAAGASGYDLKRFATVVTLCRIVRYSVIAVVADRYGRRFIGILRHPEASLGVLLLLVLIIAGFIAIGIRINRRLSNAAEH